MNKSRRKSQMLIPTVIMAALALILSYIAFKNGQGQHITGFRSAFQLTLQTLPLLIFAFIVAGMIQTLLPQDLISKWVGNESGMPGIIVGTLAGGLTPGGPYVSLPIVAGLLKSGAGTGTMVAFLTSWSLWAVSRLPMEVGILGWQFTAIRLCSTLIFPPIAGIIANIISKFLTVS
ncbi:permease [Candidatus Latescibacterota bacterium]